jgi:hypothetical protein
MDHHTSITCSEHADRYLCPDALVAYVPEFDEYGLIIHDGGHSKIAIAYCPWCGNQLPPSQRDQWFEELEALGFDDPFSQELPEIYRTNAWYRS